jgi:hypothetical protein
MKKGLVLVWTLCATLFFLACSNVDLPTVREEVPQEAPVILGGESLDNESFVTSTQAAAVVEAFFNKQATAFGSGVNTRAAHALGTSIETVKEDDNPLMYIINYPEGGFAIVSATRNYYPILAYSEEGSFELSPATGWGGVAVWLGETKEAIKGSEALDDSIKSTMRAAWTSFEPVEINRVENPLRNNVTYARYAAMDNRMGDLMMQYSSSGWDTYYPLDVADEFLPNSGVGQELYEAALNRGASPQFSILAIKEVLNTQQVGPLLTTQWHQNAPFNNECPDGSPAGCVAIAMAQIMKFHQYPTFYNWSNMPDLASHTSATSSTPALISHIGEAVDMNYSSSGSTTTVTKAKNAFQNTYGYSVTKANHNATQVKNEILNNQRPVFMTGVDANEGGHAWVCGGVKVETRTILYFAEFQLDSNYSYYVYNTADDPGSVGTYTSWYFHMNWGWGGGPYTAPNAWFYENNVYVSISSSTSYNFQSSRENLFVHP